MWMWVAVIGNWISTPRVWILLLQNHRREGKTQTIFHFSFPFCRLHSGWSVKTANLDKWKQPDPMSTDEHEKILEVIEKAEAMERAEMQRVGYVREDEA